MEAKKIYTKTFGIKALIYAYKPNISLNHRFFGGEP